LARGGLFVLSVAYEAVVAIRNRLFDADLRRTSQAEVPVISVGNITTGGTGKTPVVAHLANWFIARGLRPVLLSRGYRSLDGAVNDEKLVLDRLCPGVPHVQNPDRVVGAQTAVREHGADVLILDDGFQHRRLARELDIVLIDCLNPWGYGYLLPRGLLREPLSGLRRADLIVLTRADLCPAEDKRRIVDRLAEIRGRGECVEAAFRPSGLINAAGEAAALESLTGQSILAFCGIGNPDGFRRSLDHQGWPLDESRFRTFPDHHHHTAEELDQLGTAARQTGAAAVLTTLKDLVKIDQVALGSVPLWAVTIGMEILAGADLLEDALQSIAARCRRTPPAGEAAES
jgi:tetraacyldisaccharide 4'-kinase